MVLSLASWASGWPAMRRRLHRHPRAGLRYPLAAHQRQHPSSSTTRRRLSAAAVTTSALQQHSNPRYPWRTLGLSVPDRHHHHHRHMASRHFTTRLASSSSSSSSSSSLPPPQEPNNKAEAEGNDTSTSPTITTTRTTLLHEQLQRLGIDPTQLQDASALQYRDPIQGYDGRFGKSAIRAYRSFVNGNSNDGNNKKTSNHHQQQSPSPEPLAAHAVRVAQQIDFLRKRHAAHQAEWIRHHDGTTTTTTATTTATVDDDSAARDDNMINNPETTTTTTTTATRFPLILILDNVRSALNVGSLFRTADAAGCAQVWLRMNEPTFDSCNVYIDDRDHTSSQWKWGGETPQIRPGCRTCGPSPTL